MFDKSFSWRQELRRTRLEAEETAVEDVELAGCVEQQKAQCSLVLVEQKEQCFNVLVELEMIPSAPTVYQSRPEDNPG